MNAKILPQPLTHSLVHQYDVHFLWLTAIQVARAPRSCNVSLHRLRFFWRLLVPGSFIGWGPSKMGCIQCLLELILMARTGKDLKAHTSTHCSPRISSKGPPAHEFVLHFKWAETCKTVRPCRSTGKCEGNAHGPRGILPDPLSLPPHSLSSWASSES